MLPHISFGFSQGVVADVRELKNKSQRMLLTRTNLKHPIAALVQ